MKMTSLPVAISLSHGWSGGYNFTCDMVCRDCFSCMQSWILYYKSSQPLVSSLNPLRRNMQFGKMLNLVTEKATRIFIIPLENAHEKYKVSIESTKSAPETPPSPPKSMLQTVCSSTTVLVYELETVGIKYVSSKLLAERDNRGGACYIEYRNTIKSLGFLEQQRSAIEELGETPHLEPVFSPENMMKVWLWAFKYDGWC